MFDPRIKSGEEKRDPLFLNMLQGVSGKDEVRFSGSETRQFNVLELGF